MRQMTKFASLLSVPALGVFLLACAPVSMPQQSEGARFFAANCKTCHGAKGQGDGQITVGLDAIPPDLTVLARGNGGVFPRARALGYIYGTPDGGHLARVMPQFGAEMALDLVPVEIDGVMTPTPRALVGLLAYLEDIQR